MGKRVGLAVVGLGRMGRLYAEIIAKRVASSKLVAVYSRTRAKCEEAARSYGAKCSESFEELLRDPEVEGVVIATPSYTHAELVIRAAEEGKHVFVEKPIDVDVEKARRAISVAERKGVKLLVGYMRRFYEPYRKAKRIVDSGSLGTPYAYVGISKDPEPPPPGWLRDPRLSGGLVLDLMSHDFDLARWFLGKEPLEVFAIGSEFHGLGLRDYDSVVVTIRFEGNAFATVVGSRKSSYGYDVRSEIHCTEGAVFVGSNYLNELSVSRSGKVEFEGLSWFQRKFLEAYVSEVEHFVNLVAGLEEKPLVSGVDALKALWVAIAARKSLEIGKPVAIER